MQSMLPLFAALGSGLAFTFLSFSFKAYARPGAPPLALPALLAFLCPVWGLLLLLAYANNLAFFNLSPQALIFPLAWAACTVTTTTILVWLLSNFSLTEVAGYKKSLLTLSALGADVFIFAASFPPLKLAAIGLLLGGAVALGHTRNRTPTGKEWLILAAWSLTLTAQISLYKHGQTLQPEVISHTLLTQFFATALYALVWLVPSVRAHQAPPPRAVALLLAFAFTGVVLEGFAYAGLNLAPLIVVTILPATLFAAHDLWRGELKISPETATALAAIVTGFLLLIHVQQ